MHLIHFQILTTCDRGRIPLFPQFPAGPGKSSKSSTDGISAPSPGSNFPAEVGLVGLLLNELPSNIQLSVFSFSPVRPNRRKSVESADKRFVFHFFNFTSDSISVIYKSRLICDSGISGILVKRFSMRPSVVVKGVASVRQDLSCAPTAAGPL
jgi:hypothetical protein